MTVYWKQLPADERELVESWLRDHPDAQGVASAEGYMLAVREEHNRYPRQTWESWIASRPEVRELLCCPGITGHTLEHPPVPARNTTLTVEERMVASEAFKQRLDELWTKAEPHCSACAHALGNRKCSRLPSTCSACQQRIDMTLYLGRECPEERF